MIALIASITTIAHARALETRKANSIRWLS
jgi:hypothetical protein